MSTPTYCTSCGHELGVGRFCTNCGRPVPGRHPDAAPVIDAPRTPPATVPAPVGAVPQPARYPLFADEVVAPTTVIAPAAPAPIEPAEPAERSTPSRAPLLPWAAALLAAVVIATLAIVLLTGGDDADGRATDTTSDKAPEQASEPASERGTDPTAGATDQPDSKGTDGPVAAPAKGELTDLATGVVAEVPATAPASRDRANKEVDFEAANLTDGDTRTAWRMPGDGTDAVLTLDLGQDAVVTEVGLINGYAKSDGPNNWYKANRRVRAVQWEFDDGTRITQEFGDKRGLQSMKIAPVRTRVVRIHLVTVSAPGKAAGGRDFTALSEIRVTGAPA